MKNIWEVLEEVKGTPFLYDERKNKEVAMMIRGEALEWKKYLSQMLLDEDRSVENKQFLGGAIGFIDAFFGEQP